MSRRTDLQKLITIYTRRLQLLQEQQALHGLNTPPEILLEIEDIETRLADLQATLASLDNPAAPPGPGRVLTEAEVVAQLDRHEAAAPPHRQTQIGGVNISGSSGSTIIVGNTSANVSADGDIVGGDKITTTAPGDNDSPQTQLEAALAKWRQEVDAIVKKLSDQDDRDYVEKTANKMVAEVQKGQGADLGKIEGFLDKMSNMAPDILEVTAATLQNPFAGVGLVLKKINDRVKLERRATQG
jgi:hypothetical protein